MKTEAVRLEGIAKQYVPPWQIGLRKRRLHTVRALEDVSLTLNRGEICGLLGVNGAGKTTLIKILATLILPDRGAGLVDGIDLARFPLQVKARIGLVTTNERSFYWRLSVRENLNFFAALHGLERKQAKERIGEMLALHQGRIAADLDREEIRRRIGDQGVYRLDLSPCDPRLLAGCGISPLTEHRDEGRLVLTFRAAESMIPEMLADLAVGGARVFQCLRCEASLEELFALIVAQEKS